MTIGFNANSTSENSIEYTKVEESGNKFYNNNGTPIGRVYSDDNTNSERRVYVAIRERENHFHRKNNSFAIDSRTVKKLDKQWPKVDTVAILVKDTNNIFIFDLDSYINAKEENFGHGYQKFPDQSEAHTVIEGVYEFDEYYPDEIKVNTD